MDLRKELKLSDLVPKRAPKAKSKKPKAARKAATGRRRGAQPTEVVGLKVGATAITAAVVANNGSKEVVRVARGPLPHGVVDGGEVRDPVALGQALSEFFAQHSLPRKNVRLGLANNRIGVRVIEVAGIEDERQLENAIGFRAHEMLSVPIDEAVIDYHVLSTETGEDGSTTRKILLVVAYRDSVDRYLEATDAAKLGLCGVDLDAFALLRAVDGVGEEQDGGEELDDAAVVAVNVGHERTTLAIAEHGVCVFTRVLEWGGGNVGAAL